MRERATERGARKRSKTRLQGRQSKGKHPPNEKREEGTYMEERERISRYAG